jgi:predicted transcriptional regulator
MNSITTVRELSPEEAAEQIYAAHAHEGAWLDAFAESLDRRRASRSFARTMEVWGLSQSEAAHLFGVSRQALGKWLRQGIPTERTRAISDLAAATDLLVHYLKRDRIPAVVRRPAHALEEASLMDLLTRGDTRTLLATCRDMFRFERTHA